jgi:hypothetical protein
MRARGRFFTPFITADIGYAYGFVFAACNLAGAAVVFFFLYESADLSLEGVDQMYNDPTTKAWKSRNWAPQGYADRRDLVAQTRAAEAQKPLQDGTIGTGAGTSAGAREAQLEKAPAGVNGHGSAPGTRTPTDAGGDAGEPRASMATDAPLAGRRAV